MSDFFPSKDAQSRCISLQQEEHRNRNTRGGLWEWSGRRVGRTQMRRRNSLGENGCRIEKEWKIDGLENDHNQVKNTCVRDS